MTQHAQDVIKERGIAMQWVESTINNPQITVSKTSDGLEHRLAVIPDYGRRVLRVIINPRTSPIKVVTAFFDRSMKGKL